MADVAGPVRTLPGHIKNAPVGMCCDEHEDRPAVKRVQGETDSFGAEWIDMCEECYAAHLVDDTPTVTVCDRCRGKLPTKPWRDPDEGSTGPVYWVCDDCRKKLNRYYDD